HYRLLIGVGGLVLLAQHGMGKTAMEPHGPAVRDEFENLGIIFQSLRKVAQGGMGTASVVPPLGVLGTQREGFRVIHHGLVLLAQSGVRPRAMKQRRPIGWLGLDQPPSVEGGSEPLLGFQALLELAPMPGEYFFRGSCRIA